MIPGRLSIWDAGRTGCFIFEIMAQVDTAQLRGIWQGLNGQLLPRSSEVNKQVREFMLKEQKGASC